MAGKWWILRDGGAGEPGEAAEGHGAQENFFLHAPATTTNGAKITPVSPISRCPRAFHRVVRARRPAARPAAWPGRASRLAGPGQPALGRAWPAARPAAFHEVGALPKAKAATSPAEPAAAVPSPPPPAAAAMPAATGAFGSAGTRSPGWTTCGQDDYGGGGEELTTGFLDSDDDDVGEGNLGAIKRKFTGKDKKGKRKGSTQPAIRAAFGGKQLRRPGRRDEGSDSSEEREESEEDGNSEEMEGFIVKDDGAEASDSEEEEAEESDDSEEAAKAPKKRGRK